MYFAYAITQAEQPKTAAEQRAADTRQGELALAFSRLLHRSRETATPAAQVPAQRLPLRHDARHYA